MYSANLQPDLALWDQFVAQHPRTHFLQLGTWGVFKAEFGWSAQQIGLLDESGKLVAGAQILYRRLPFRLGTLAYIPFGPLVDWQDMSQVKALFKVIDRATREQGAVFLKLEPGYDVNPNILRKIGCRPSPQTIQPPRTVVVDIQGSDEEILLKRMNQSTRRNIRKSEKNGVAVRIGTRHDVDQFNKLLQVTSERQNFGVHVGHYYERIYDLFIAQQTPLKAALLMAAYQDETTLQWIDLAGIFVFVLGTQSWYQYGASSDLERHRMASFGVQWAAIQWAQQQGAKAYDMVGVPDFPPDVLEAEFENREDGLWGVYRFKRGWGGRVIRTVGAWDRVYRPPIYWAYRAYLTWRNANSPEG